MRELSHHLQNPDLSGVALDQLKLAEQAFKDKNFDFALKLCDKACLESNHLRPFFYDIVGDIYIAKNNFLLAEVYILQALSMGHSSFKVYFNLSTLASIRKRLYSRPFLS